MGKHNKRESLKSEPVKQHTTATGEGIEKLQNTFPVAVTSERQVEDAKDWVDSNQK